MSITCHQNYTVSTILIVFECSTPRRQWELSFAIGFSVVYLGLHTVLRSHACGIKSYTIIISANIDGVIIAAILSGHSSYADNVGMGDALINIGIIKLISRPPRRRICQSKHVGRNLTPLCSWMRKQANVISQICRSQIFCHWCYQCRMRTDVCRIYVPIQYKLWLIASVSPFIVQNAECLTYDERKMRTLNIKNLNTCFHVIKSAKSNINWGRYIVISI